LGFIERRSTRGRFVASGGSGPRSRALVSAWLHQHAAEIAEIDDVRSLIESHALGAARPDDVPEILQRLRLILEEQQDAIAEGDVSAAAAADTEFHKLVCSMTRNRTLHDLATALVDRSRQVSVAAYAIPESAASGLLEHSRVVDALARGEVASAAELLREHIVTSSARNVEAGESSTAAPKRGPLEPSMPVATDARGQTDTFDPEIAPIQIDQRIPRCARCGKMINVRGGHLSVALEDNGQLLVCSLICRDEIAATLERLDADEAPAAAAHKA
jgi:DNA-binding FadR family transcriptional regulator